MAKDDGLIIIDEPETLFKSFHFKFIFGDKLKEEKPNTQFFIYYSFS